MVKSKKLMGAAAGVIAAMGITATRSVAAPFVPGNLVVVQVNADGSGSAPTSNATATFLDEYNPLVPNVRVQQIALPTAVSGSNRILTLSGTATSEGFLTLSSNATYLTIGGYNAAPGTASITTGIGNRVVGRVDLAGNIDTTTLLGDASSLGNIRSTVSDDGVNFWVGTSGSGIRYTTLGSTGATVQLSTSPTNVRVVNIFGNQLYTSSASGVFQGVATVGSGKPTTSGQTTTQLPGFPTTTGPGPYDYYFADANTLYVADDRSVGTLNTGGLEKWTFNGSTWSIAYTLVNGITTGLRGLTALPDGSGNTVLYATTSDGARLVTITDQTSATVLPASAFATIATAGTNTVFRGVDLASVPEPASLGLGLGALALLLGRRPRRSGSRN